MAHEQTNPGSGKTDPDIEQEKIVDFLKRPDTFGAGRIDFIETHISYVFLAGHRAYKMKRALRLPFLDYSTLELRREACEEELRINRAFAPEMYLDVTPVCRDDGGFNLRGQGEVCDWLVVMDRFEAEDQFDRMAAEGRLTSAHMRDLSDIVADIHLNADVRPDQGGSEAMAAIIEDNVAEITELSGETAPGSEIEEYDNRSRKALAGCSQLLDSRRDNGFVRRAHGDLHLGNICLFRGRPTPFDGIEFSDEIACCDVLYDLAFLIMDLCHRQRPDLANLIFNRYLAMTEDYGGLTAFPLFLSCRAAVRAKVDMLTAASQSAEPTTEAIFDEARAYLALANALLTPSSPSMIVLGGYSGTGKSTLAAALAPELGIMPGAVLIRSDIVRKRLWGQPPESPLPSVAYTGNVTERVYQKLLEQGELALNAGYTVIVDAVYLREHQRLAAENLAHGQGVPFHGLWLHAPLEVLRQRVGERKNDASDADASIVEGQLQAPTGTLNWHKIDASGSPSRTLGQARQALMALGKKVPLRPEVLC
jgi:aminoglycoside phosphotransferase family enzyme/gluconate kinase